MHGYMATHVQSGGDVWRCRNVCVDVEVVLVCVEMCGDD